MIVKCPYCGGEIDCTEEYLGTTALCPHCGEAMTMPPRPRRRPRWLWPVIVIAVAMSIQLVGVVVTRPSASQDAPAADRRAVAASAAGSAKQPPTDPIYERYGHSERQFKQMAYSSAKKIVIAYLLADRNRCSFPFAAATDHTKFFLFEKFNQGADGEWHSAGEWVGVNVISYVDVRLYDIYGGGKGEARRTFSGTFHFDPELRSFNVIDFAVDGQKLTFDQPAGGRQ